MSKQRSEERPDDEQSQESQPDDAEEKAEEACEAGQGIVADKTLSDRLRFRILGVGLKHLTSPSDFSRETGEDLSKVSYHFRVMRDLGDLELVDEIKVRGSLKHMYRATRQAMIKTAEWKLYNAAIKAGIRTATLQDFVATAAEAILAGTFDAKDDSNFSWKACLMDEQGWADLMGILKRAYDEAVEVEVQSAQRAAEDKTTLFPVTFAVAGFESSTREQPAADDEQEPEEKPKSKEKKGKQQPPEGKKKPKKKPGGKGKKGKRSES